MMVTFDRLDGKVFAVNPDHVLVAVGTEDEFVTSLNVINGGKSSTLLVKGSFSEVVAKLNGAL